MRIKTQSRGEPANQTSRHHFSLSLLLQHIYNTGLGSNETMVGIEKVTAKKAEKEV